MKLLATAILAGAVLVAPLAIGQSQGMKLDSVATSAAQVMQASSASLLAPRATPASASLEAESPSANPDPMTSWLMALAVLGIIAVRRIRT